jgi:ubiquinone/menaquinone biosynthesis C-methylase UbiE
MSESPDFHELSYSKHSKLYQKGEDSSWTVKSVKEWWRRETIDVWRHLRMMEVLQPLLANENNKKWLIVGDGQYASSSLFISSLDHDAIPLDIDDTNLKIAKEHGLINEYIHGNAESIPSENGSFDYSFCKESFHHFPRPMIALYEMIRVSKEAIIFTEPSDWIPLPVPRRILQLLKHWILSLFGRKPGHSDQGNYEPVGNYIYTISLREMEKIALALNLPAIVYKRFQDYYAPGVENAENNRSSGLFRKVNRSLKMNSIAYALGLSGKNRISIVLFKKKPSEKLLESFRRLKYKVISLPRNPYV